MNNEGADIDFPLPPLKLNKTGLVHVLCILNLSLISLQCRRILGERALNNPSYVIRHYLGLRNWQRVRASQKRVQGRGRRLEEEGVGERGGEQKKILAPPLPLLH